LVAGDVLIDDRSKTIYIVDLFWKKTNKVSLADLHRIITGSVN